MIELPSSVSAIFTIWDVPNDDTLPGPYDPSEGDTVFATWFDFTSGSGAFFEVLSF